VSDNNSNNNGINPLDREDGEKGDEKNGEGREPLGGFSPKNPRRTMLYLLIIALVACFVAFGGKTASDASGVESLSTSEFTAAVKDERVDTAVYKTATGKISGYYWEKKSDVGTDSKREAYTSMYVSYDHLTELMEDHPEIEFDIDTSSDEWIETILISVVPTLILIGIVIYFFNQMQGQNGQAMNFGRTKAKTTEQTRPKTKFTDVAGIDEAVEELQEVKDFLTDPERYHKMGAKIPRGVLLVGPPGTGKTLLAKAVAGEAGVPFFSISGSDFVEMFVGVGASRVRDLFKQAKESSPSIIFIDEIDAVGRQRGAGLGGGHDEREQTLNQLLVEMDGFEDKQAVILIAATNRPDILDPALLRPGRFDRQVTVDRPDVKGREKILRVHSEGKPLAKDIDLADVARLTPGFTGADLANLMNEAALLAARRHKDVITGEEVQEATERVVAGPERKSRVITERERTTIAYHESGHALVGHLLEHADPVHKISIVSRGMALGYTMAYPDEDKFLETRNGMLDSIAMMLGGRTAEELFCDDITTGASNDLERATKLARQMVTRYGMSADLGTQVFGEAQHQVFLGRDLADHQDYSPETAKRIDDEVARIMREAHERARKTLEDNRDRMEKMAEVLLVTETVEGEPMLALLDGTWDEFLAAHPDEAAKFTEQANAEAKAEEAAQQAAEEAAAADRAIEEQAHADALAAMAAEAEGRSAEGVVAESATATVEEAAAAEEVAGEAAGGAAASTAETAADAADVLADDTTDEG